MGYTREDLRKIRTTPELVSWTYALQDDLEEFAYRLHAVCNHFPFDDKGGRPAEQALAQYIRCLGQIYEQITGAEARITHEPYAGTCKVTPKTHTEFWKFLGACMWHIAPKRYKEKAFVGFAGNPGEQ